MSLAIEPRQANSPCGTRSPAGIETKMTQSRELPTTELICAGCAKKPKKIRDALRRCKLLRNSEGLGKPRSVLLPRVQQVWPGREKGSATLSAFSDVQRSIRLPKELSVVVAARYCTSRLAAGHGAIVRWVGGAAGRAARTSARQERGCPTQHNQPILLSVLY
jgi:hypothetical protein